jgi:hypothetical protein
MERSIAMSSLTQHVSDTQPADLGAVQRLTNLKSEVSELTARHPSGGLSVGGAVAQARQQIPIICQNIDDAIRALDTGLDRSGNPVTKRQISDGLKRLVEATRNPGLVGLLTAVLASHGIQRFEHHMGELERIAEEIGRPDWIAPADKHASHMSAILEWCKRNRDKVVNVNVVSFSGEAHETTRNTAKGTIRSIEEHPHQKGVYRLEFDSQK